jgi:hypothetical protein
LFAGVPGPALQQPRFSGPLAPGTRPRHRFGLRLWTQTINDEVVRQPAVLDARPRLRFEERLESEGDGWQRLQPDNAISVDGFCVRSLELSASSGQGALIGVNVPDFAITTSLIVRELFSDVIPPR